MTITLNNRPYPWREGMTVSQLLDENGYIYKRITVSINGKHVDAIDWQTKIINEGDKVVALHALAGGD